MKTFLDFEKPIADLEGKIEELRRLNDEPGEGVDIKSELQRLESKVKRLLKDTYDDLQPWQRVQIARHPDRPKCCDYIEQLITDFTPLAGDRLFAEDLAIVGGLGRFEGQPVVVIGQERGKDTQSRLKHNFGMPRPEGYRKAQRLMDLADRFQLPVLTFVDTPGAYPGIDAEERGQSEAIAKSIEKCLRIGVPIITTVIGEGGSGGAIAIATGDVILMMENAVYSVISPEGCASILWRSASEAKQAAEALRITAQDLYKLGIIDEVVGEPLGGAQRDRKKAVEAAGKAIAKHLKPLQKLDGDKLRQQRADKFLAMTKKGLN